MKINLNSDRLGIYDFEVEVDVEVRHDCGNATYWEPGWHDVEVEDWNYSDRKKVEADLAEQIRMNLECSDTPVYMVTIKEVEELVDCILRKMALRGELD